MSHHLFVTRAVHLENIKGLTKECFLNGLRWFIARPGRPEVIYSDNATTTSGAKNFISEERNNREKGDELKQYFTSNINLQCSTRLGEENTTKG